MTRLARILVYVAAGVLVLLLLGALVLQTPWVKDYLRGIAERQAERALGAEVTIGRLTGNLFTGAVLHDFAISRAGEPVVTAPRIEVDYSVLDLLTGDIDISSIALAQPTIYLRRTEEGYLNLAALGAAGAEPAGTAGAADPDPGAIAEPRPETAKGVDPVPPAESLAGETEPAAAAPGRGWAIGEVIIQNGTLVIADNVVESDAVNAPERLVDLDADLSVRSNPAGGGVLIDIESLSFQTQQPELRVARASGELLFSSDVVRFDEFALQTGAGAILVDGAIRERQTTPVYDLRLGTRDLSLAALAPFVPALESYELSPTIEATLKGPATSLDVQFEVRMQAGQVRGDVTIDTTAPKQAFQGTVQTTDLNLAPLLPGSDAQTNLTLDAQFNLTLPGEGLDELQGTYTVKAPEFQYAEYTAKNVTAKGKIKGRRIGVDASADIYGGQALVTGSITLPEGDVPIRYDLDGKLRNVDPAQLPKAIRPPGAGSMGRRSGPGSARHVPGTAPIRPPRVVLASYPSLLRPAIRRAPRPGIRGTSELRAYVRPAMYAAWMQQAGGNDGIDLDFTIRGRGSDIEAEATLLDFSLAGADFGEQTRVEVSREGERLSYSAAGTVRSLSLRRLGEELGLEALTEPRFASDINAIFDISGAGSELADLTLRGTATLTDSEVLGANFPRLTVEPDLTRGSGSFALEGAFAGVDVGAIAGNPALESSLQGTIDARVQLENLASPDFSVGALNARGELTLEDSSVAGVRIDRAVVDGAISESLARLERVSVIGPDMEVQISGTLALDETGTSDLKYLIDTPALQQFERFGVPARGDVLLEGTVAGNFGRLVVNGRLSGSQVAYGDTQAGVIHSEYAVVIPDLSPAQASVDARTELTALEAGGRRFTTVKAATEYEAGTIAFDTVVQDESRTIDAEGRVVWHPDHQELHLRRLGLQTPDATWRSPEGMDATIRYGGEALAVGDFALVSNAGGRIEVDGSLGEPGSTLQASIDGLQLDSIDDFFLDEPLSGVADIEAVVRGSFAEPRVEANLAIRNGGYRGFDYQVVSGEVTYKQALLALDITLTQTEGAVFTAEGVIPLSEKAGEALDVAVRSTPIDLVLVQAFTDELQDVRGTAELDLRATGALSAPVLEGTLQVRQGAFFVVLAQSRYTGFDTLISFEKDVVSVREFNLTDDDGDKLRIGGKLALQQGGVRDVDIRVLSKAFEITDNRFAELNVDTDVRVTGTLTSPQIAGRVAVADGFIRIDRILEVLAGPASVDVEEEEPAAEEPGAFAPSVALELAIPESLIVRGSDIRVGGGVPIGLGDVNITLAGDLKLVREPGEELLLTGEVLTVRGAYEFQGRRFEIQRAGRVVFTGSTEDLNPFVDVSATREISGVTARVQVGGLLSAPELTLSSTPPMSDAEILSLIVFNQPLSLLGSGQQVSLATRAASLASGFVASRLTESLSDALEVDLIEIKAQAEQGQGLTPVLTVGEQFGDLFVRLEQRFGPEAASEAVLEYRLAEWLRLQTSFAQGNAATRNLLQRFEAGGVDLLFAFSY